MEYISAEEFLKQPNEVQGVFIDWWKPSVGDICAFKAGHSGYYSWYMSCIQCERDIEAKLHEIPLLTEGQLRKFIEDKTGYKVDCDMYDGVYDINICSKGGRWIKKYECVDDNLLQAYWKVAVETALSIVNEGQSQLIN